LFESVKKGTVYPLYFLYGPEEHLKKEFIRELLDQALSGGNRVFNLDVIYGDEFDRAAFNDRVGSFPLFTDRRVVILRNFKALSTSNKDFVIESAGKTDDSLVFVVETPEDKLDTAGLRKLEKLANKRGLVFKFEHLDDDETVERVKSRFKRDGFDIRPDALALLAESVGPKLIDLINEVDKIKLAAGDEKTVDKELVASVVGRYRTENLFSLLDNLDKKSPAVMIRSLNRLVDAGEEPVVMIGMLLKRVVLLMQVQALTAEHGRRVANDRALAGMMIPPVGLYYAGKLLEQSKRIEASALDTMLHNFRWADLKLKTSQLVSKHIIEEALLASHVGKTLAYTGPAL
jgi:DNA polymerase-3 subunit delta